MNKKIVKLTRSASQERTRQHLLKAAHHEVAKWGAGASVRDIARTAGYSQGALYANFGSKEGLLLELMRVHKQEELTTLTSIFENARGEADIVLEGLKEWSKTLHADADWAVLAIELELYARRSKSFAARYRKVQKGYSLVLGSLIERFFKMKKLAPPCSPIELAAGFMALAHGLAIHRSQKTNNPGKTIMTFFHALVKSAEPL